MSKVQDFFNIKFGQLRGFEIDGEVFVVGIDIAKCLGYTNPQKALRDHVRKKFRKVNESFTLSSGSPPILISEPGIYQLIFSSKMPDAEEFQDWVFEEVLPALRNEGAYLDKEHYKIRALGIAIRNMETRSISFLIKYAKEDWDIDITEDESYKRLSALANKLSGIETGKRDESSAIKLAICAIIETAIKTTIRCGVKNGLEPYTIIDDASFEAVCTWNSIEYALLRQKKFTYEDIRGDTRIKLSKNRSTIETKDEIYNINAGINDLNVSEESIANIKNWLFGYVDAA